MKSFTEKHKLLTHPIASVIVWMLVGFFVVSIVLGGLMALTGKLLNGDGNHESLETYANAAILIVGTIILLLIFKLIYRPQFKGFAFFDFFKEKEVVFCIAAFIIICILSTVVQAFMYGATVPSFSGVATAAMAAVSEEITDRLLPLAAAMFIFKNRKSVVLPLVLSSVLFGLGHYINIDESTPFFPVTIQVISAGFAGLIMGAMYIRTGSFLPEMLTHFIHNFGCYAISEAQPQQGTVTVVAGDWIDLVVLSVASVILTIVLLKGKSEKINTLWNKIWTDPPELTTDQSEQTE